MNINFVISYMLVVRGHRILRTHLIPNNLKKDESIFTVKIFIGCTPIAPPEDINVDT